MAGRTGRLLAFFARTEPRGAPPSAWALALDAALAVAAAAGAVYQVAERNLGYIYAEPGLAPGAVPGPVRGLGGPLSEQFSAPLAGYLRRYGDTLLAHAVPVHASYGALAAAALTALPLAARRVYPVGAWLAVAAAIVYVHPTYVPPVALGTAIYAAYSAITHSRYRNLAIAVVAVVTFLVAGTLGDALPRFPARSTAILAMLVAAGAGLGIRGLRRRLADSTARLSRAADEAKAATERALAAERSRIASELHDVVTHNVSVMIVQAGAARKIMASSPGDAEDALLAVEATGREAMTELRNLLGLLSPAGDGTDGSPGAAPSGAGALEAGVPAAAGPAAGVPAAGVPAAGGLGHGPVPAALRPQPGLGELDALIGRVSAAGLPVRLAVGGEPRPLPPGAGLAAYRVVQEGLTNVLRHAGAASATVAVDWGENLAITVGDDGPGGGLSGPAPGRGLLGLRERLALYGGELAAGPRPEGGWRVRAVLPLTGLPGPKTTATEASGLKTSGATEASRPETTATEASRPETTATETSRPEATRTRAAGPGAAG